MSTILASYSPHDVYVLIQNAEIIATCEAVNILKISDTILIHEKSIVDRCTWLFNSGVL